MKTLEQDITVHTRGVQGKIEYKVQSNAKMQRLLSDSLYSDKIRSVIRELSTNAWDAHVMAGNNKPFDVYLPSRDKPVFKIRDYGTGMAPKQVENMYQTYGASDKTHTNKQQGCMGLGSKSPFCYTNSFTTASYYNGTKIIWVNCPDKQGKFYIDRIATEKTNEPNGLEISFGCNKADIHEFIQKAKLVYRPFPVKPNVIGTGYEDLEYKFLMHGNGWSLRDEPRNYYNSTESFAIMGFVEYPIDASQFGNNDRYSGSKNQYVQLLNLGFNLHFDIGQVEMHISRESLQYHAATIQSIKNRLDSVLIELKKQIDDRLKNCKSLWEARCLYGELTDGDLSHIKSLLTISDVEFNGKKIKNGKIIFPNKNCGATTLIRFNQYNKEIKREMSRVDITPKIFSSTKFYINDLKRGSYAAVMRDMADNNIDKGYLFRFPETIDKTSFDNYMGMPDDLFIKTSTIPKAVRQKRGQIINTFTFDSNVRSNYYWNESKLCHKTNSGIYVEINNWKCKIHRIFETPRQLRYIVEGLKGIDISVPVIYGIKSNQISKFEKSKNWTKFHDWIEKQIKNYLSNTDINESFHVVKEWKDFKKNRLIDELSRYKFPDNSEMQKVVDNFVEIKGKIDEHDKKSKNINLLSNYLSFQIPEKPSSKRTLQEQYENLVKIYPMIEIVDNWNIRNGEGEKIVDYVKLVGK